MTEQHSTKRFVRPLENWLTRVVVFTRERKRWWEKISGYEKGLTRDMPQPRPRGPAEQPAAGPSKQNAAASKKDTKSTKSLFAIKKDTKKDTSNLKKVAGEHTKGPYSHSKS